MANWWNLEIEKVITQTGSSAEGLSSSEAEGRLAESGYNELLEKPRKPEWKIFLHQFKDFMILILLVAAAVAGIIGDLTDTIIIVCIVMINAVVGYFQE